MLSTKEQQIRGRKGGVHRTQFSALLSPRKKIKTFQLQMRYSRSPSHKGSKGWCHVIPHRRWKALAAVMSGLLSKKGKGRGKTPGTMSHKSCSPPFRVESLFFSHSPLQYPGLLWTCISESLDLSYICNTKLYWILYIHFKKTIIFSILLPLFL